MKRRYKVGWALVALIALLPWLALLTAGGYWLWGQHYYREWLWALLACSGVAWIAGRALQRRQPPAGYQDAFRLPVGAVLSPRDEAARREVEAYAKTCCQRENLAFDQAAQWLAIAREVVGIVARHYKPGAEHPELAIPLTGLFQISEKVLRDLRLVLLKSIPASHIVTLEDGLNLSRWYDRITDVSLLWRLLRLPFNPLGALATEMSTSLLGRVSKLPLRTFQKWVLAFFINRVGLYAIELYSGRAVLPEPIAAPAPGQPEPVCPPCGGPRLEPLSILVCGQTKSGKSTLVNALCDSLCAPVDCIPCTADIAAYRLCREGLLDGVILDTPGYGQNATWLDESQAELDRVDLILLVIQGPSAAREADARFSQAVRQYFLKRLDRLPPPVVVVASKIDQFRPAREWSPPYDVNRPERPKEQRIVAALEEIRRALAFPPETPIVPVSATERYNIDGLWLVIAGQLPEAKSVNLLRCHANTITRDRYDQLRKQLYQSGRWLWDALKDRLS